MFQVSSGMYVTFWRAGIAAGVPRGCDWTLSKPFQVLERHFGDQTSHWAPGGVSHTLSSAVPAGIMAFQEKRGGGYWGVFLAAGQRPLWHGATSPPPCLSHPFPAASEDWSLLRPLLMSCSTVLPARTWTWWVMGCSAPHPLCSLTLL